MSAGGAGGGATAAYPQQTIMAIGAVGGLAGIYLGHFMPPAFSFFGGLGAICAIVWGADAVRRVASYGLGTGVPSIGMIALGMGIVAALFGLSVGGIAGPIVSFIAAAIIGAVIGVLANKVIGMGIPIMEQAMVEIAGAGTLAIIGLSVVIAGTFNYADVVQNVVANGYIALIFIIGGMGILHPFNANLGPDEKQDRTLMLAVEKAAIAVVITGFASSLHEGLMAAGLNIFVGLVIWAFAFMKYYELVKRDAFSVVGTGLLPSAEELE
ncbi:MAG: tetrahydromethanopterin S-methyltransferase subunit C [Methanosarcina sp.]|uniref:tetrahydromethanopterin S-methyltransferase subunit MtrC n=1 Tax=Methanosarcina sp. TaxID=2213 RepID=UPI00260D022A|nr:tetrahydromethanopterin S-methyltransferase subunit C [Methanosarcina sp.]MDD3245909.1 tetrahydromethanopterin S-methyltransferase subunit C [Methanosarcina sp.]MDD4249681.1 tetrahydromethanopterin S-methyltransferase subunit C [Methanosarcina sp.]